MSIRYMDLPLSVVSDEIDLRSLLAAGTHIARYCGVNPIVPHRRRMELQRVKDTAEHTWWHINLPSQNTEVHVDYSLDSTDYHDSETGEEVYPLDTPEGATWRSSIRQWEPQLFRTDRHYSQGNIIAENWICGHGHLEFVLIQEMARDDDRYIAPSCPEGTLFINPQGNTGYCYDHDADGHFLIRWLDIEERPLFFRFVRPGQVDAVPAGGWIASAFRIVIPEDLQHASEVLAKRYRDLAMQSGLMGDDMHTALNRQISRILNRYRMSGA